MRKYFLTLLSLLMVLPIASCDNNIDSSSDNFVPSNELQEAFYQLKDNNFTLDYEDSYANNGGVIRKQKVSYTSYSIERSGDLGFYGIAQGDGLIFNYDIVDNEVISSAPITNSSGIRYKNIYDYRSSFGDFDFSFLKDNKDNQGYYSYKFGENLTNDTIFADSLLFKTYTSSLDGTIAKISLQPGIINIDVTLLVYDFEKDIKDTVSLKIRNIGITKNDQILNYLEDGKSAKTPLDQRFYHFIAPYLSSYNYTSYLDASKYLDVTTMRYSTYKLNQYFTNNAVLYEDLYNHTYNGSILTQGVVVSYRLDSLDDTSITITSTPYASSDFDFYSAIYGGVVPYSFADIQFYDFVGYIDETNQNLYYLTNDYLIYMLSSLCFFEGNSTDRIITSCSLEILDEAQRRFKLSFYSYNGELDLDTGVFEAEFYDLNKTSIKACDKYLSIGDDPKTQSKDQLESILNKFNSNNYSLDLVASNIGLGKYFYTENYIYYEAYGSPNNNYGYVKEGDSIYVFNGIYNDNNVLTGVDINYDSDYALNGMQLPGVGSYFGALDDLGYISRLSDAIYDIDSYQINEMIGQTYWKNNSQGFSQLALDYIGYSTYYYPLGSGFVFTDSQDDSRLTFLVGCLAKDNSNQGIVSFTFYDVGTTSYPSLEKYLNIVK